jgi:hypothetical protein
MTTEKGGQPLKIGPNEIKEIERLAGLGQPLRWIATHLGCSEKTIHDNAKLREEVSSAIERGRAAASSQIGNSLFNKAMAGDVNAIRWYEMTRTGRAIRVQNEISGDPNNPIQHEVVHMSEEQRRARIEALEVERAKLEAAKP